MYYIYGNYSILLTLKSMIGESFYDWKHLSNGRFENVYHPKCKMVNNTLLIEEKYYYNLYKQWIKKL